MNNNRYRLFAAILGMAAVSAASADVLAPPNVSTYPAEIAAGDDFLILIDSYWPDTCGGQIEIEVLDDQINVVGTPTSTSNPGIACGLAPTPFKKLINPEDHSGIQTTFAETIAISYFVNDGDNSLRLIESRDLMFSDESTPPFRVQSGAWVTSALDSSGLFIDQQDHLLTALLSDYDEMGEPLWHFAGGSVHGNIFIGDLVAYQYTNVDCVTFPCPQIEPIRNNRVYMLFQSYDEILVDYNDAVVAPRLVQDQVATYQRLELSRNPEVSAQVPDLTGSWIAGVRGSLPISEDDFNMVTIEYLGEDQGSPLNRFVFNVLAAPEIGQPNVLYQIFCEDMRPVDGPFECSLQGFKYDGLDCQAGFALNSVGEDRLTTQASCSDENRSVNTQFDLVKLIN